MSIENRTSHEPTHAPNERAQSAREYGEQVRAFYAHAAVFVGALIIVVTVNLLTNLSAGIADELSAWWSIWAFLGSGIGLAVHGFVVRLKRP